jgi:hypothetical protein
MRSRRQFIQLASSLVAVIADTQTRRARAQIRQQIWLPVVLGPAADAPIVGSATGAPEQAIAWLVARCSANYTRVAVTEIVSAYQEYGDLGSMDWFLAIAQMAHETGSLTSWWSQRPRRNPAGLGVTGRTQFGLPGLPPPGAWAWDDGAQLWREGLSFSDWATHAVPAHLGRLLAYALTDDQASPAQRDLIDYALMYRPLPASYRGCAPTITGLNGRWAVPGTDYGQRIMDLAARMRAG